MTTGRLRTFLIAAALVLAGCGGSSTDGEVATPASSGDSTPEETGDAGGRNDAGGTGGTASGSAGAQLLSFSAPAIGGGSVAAADFRGRPTLLWFWAPW